MTAMATATDIETSGPERRCIVTGASLPKAQLLRFVVGPEGELVPDVAERLPGRGIWVRADAGALKRAVDKKLFARAARAAVRVPDDLLARLDALLVKRCQDFIGLAKRSGLLVVGYERVLEVLAEGGAGVVAVAADAGRGRHSVVRAAAGVPVVGALTTAELSDAAGKGAVAFLTVARGGLAASLQRDNERLTGLRPAGMDVSK